MTLYAFYESAVLNVKRNARRVRLCMVDAGQPVLNLIQYQYDGIFLKGYVLAVLAVCSLTFFVSGAHAIQVQKKCIDYRLPPGQTECEPPVEQVSQTSVLEEQPQEPAQQASAPAPAPPPQEKSLDVKIDEFMESYGKPPREFVKFLLDPTLENAIGWAQKYNEMLHRNFQITVAWQQAKAIMKEADTQGVEVPTLYEPMPKVPDFTEYMGEEAQANIATQFDPSGQLGQIMAVMSGGEQMKMPGTRTLDDALGDLDETPADSSARVADASGSLFPENFTPSDEAFLEGEGYENGAILVSYYFSAECPYCQRFEPEFQKIIEEMGNKLAVTCIDMTPSGQVAENVNGKVDCDWRPIEPDEMGALGIESTPTLIISRGPEMPLERIAGYVEGDQLKQHLMNPNKQHFQFQNAGTKVLQGL